MDNVYNEAFPATFFWDFSEVFHPYSTDFSKMLCKIHKTTLTKCKYVISSRQVLIWNNFQSYSEKRIESSSFLGPEMELKLYAFDNKIICSVK